jgi:ADP-ribose pyrophosphatase YjhB (NUDIX family)
VPERQPRMVALGVLIWRDHLLMGPSTIPGDPPGWRCLGGSIHLGERAADAVTREFIEETGRRVDVIEALPVIESIGSFRGEVGHELSFPFVVRWHDGYEPLDLSPIAGVEDDGTRFEARWVPLVEVAGAAATIHPPGFREALAARLARPFDPEAEPARLPKAPVRRPLPEGESLRGTQRAVALGHLVWRDHVLLAPVVEPGAPPAWRSLGGSIEFGEHAEDAVHREFLEETGRRVEVVEAKGVAENIFEYRGAIGHEAVFEYLVRWAPGEEPSDLAPLRCREHDGSEFVAEWMPLHRVLTGRDVIYPEGFVPRLSGWLGRG